MPAKLKRCVRKVKRTVKPRRRGQSKTSAAWAICVKSTGLKPHRRRRKRRRRR